MKKILGSLVMLCWFILIMSIRSKFIKPFGIWIDLIITLTLLMLGRLVIERIFKIK